MLQPLLGYVLHYWQWWPISLQWVIMYISYCLAMSFITDNDDPLVYSESLCMSATAWPCPLLLTTAHHSATITLSATAWICFLLLTMMTHYSANYMCELLFRCVPYYWKWWPIILYTLMDMSLITDNDDPSFCTL